MSLPNDDEDDDDEFRRRMANSEQLMKLLDEASQNIPKTGGIPHDEFWAMIDRKYGSKPNSQRFKQTKKRQA
jgi:hypothetical protein